MDHRSTAPRSRQAAASRSVARGRSTTATCALRILLLPIAIALVDELGRLLATARLRPAVAVLFAPFAFLDRLLTAPPEEEHLELARTALVELEKLETR